MEYTDEPHHLQEARHRIGEGRAHLCEIIRFTLDPFNGTPEQERQESRSCPPNWRVIRGGRDRAPLRSPDPDSGRAA